MAYTKKIDKPAEIEDNGIIPEPSSAGSIFEPQSSPVTTPEEKPTATPRKTTVQGADSWKPDDWNEDTWSPSNLLKIELKDKMFVPRWVREDKVLRYSDEGYVFVHYDEVLNFNKATLKDGEQMDSVVRRREMSLMKIRKDRLAAKQKYLAGKVIDPKKINEDYKEKARSQGGEVTGNVSIS